MNERFNRFTPINEVISDRIMLNIPLPDWVETEKIGLDVNRTIRLMNLGGIRHTRIDFCKGEISQSGITIVGITSDGSALGGKVAAKKQISTYLINHTPEQEHIILKNAVWTNLNLNLNLEEIQMRIRQQNDSLKKAESWAPYFDQALRSGIRNVGTNHMLKELSAYQTMMVVLVNIHNGFMSAADMTLYGRLLGIYNPHIPSITELTVILGFNSIIWNLLGRRRYGNETKYGKGYRSSLFPGWEIDHAALLQIATRLKPLIIATDNK